MSLYFMHILPSSVHSQRQSGSGNHGNWFCLVCVSSSWLSVRGFNRFFQRLESCRPSSCLCLCENISTFGLPLPMTVYSLCCWGNDAVTSARRKAVWQLPLRIQTEDPVGESVWHCVRGAACTVWCAHLCRGRLWGSDDVTDTDAFQCDPAKSTLEQVKLILEGVWLTQHSLLFSQRYLFSFWAFELIRTDVS